MPLTDRSRLSFLILIGGNFLAATAVLMIKASTVAPAALAAGRLLTAAVLLSPLWWRERRKGRPRRLWPAVKPSLIPGALLGAHFIAWNSGARLTLAGNATLVVNLGPLIMPFLAWWAFRERPTRRESVGTFIAVIGLLVLGWSDYQFSPGHITGDVLCLVAMLLFVSYILLARARAQGGLFTYLVPLYAFGGLICLVWSLIFERAAPVWTPLDYLWVAGLALGPTIGGHSINNWAMTVFRAQPVALFNLTQFVFAGVLAFVFFREIPGTLFYVTAALVGLGAFIALRSTRRA